MNERKNSGSRNRPFLPSLFCVRVLDDARSSSLIRPGRLAIPTNQQNSSGQYRRELLSNDMYINSEFLPRTLGRIATTGVYDHVVSP